MEAVQVAAKPRVSFAEFQKQQRRNVAWLVEAYITEMDGTLQAAGIKRLGESHRYTLRRVSPLPIGSVLLADLTSIHLQDMCKALRARGLHASTVAQYFTYLSGAFKYARSAWADCKGLSRDTFKDAKDFLQKHQIIGKSTPRERRPTYEEIALLIEYFSARVVRKNTIDMVTMTHWQIASGRRVGESCALLWEDWNREERTILVRKMKDPKVRDKRKVVALTASAHAMLLELEARRNTAEPRIFPYAKKGVSAAYTIAKKELGIVGLRLHDSRRECASRLVELGCTSNQVRMVTGHETNAMLDRVYAKANPAKFKDIEAELLAA